ncbi:MAG TPA: metallophosphoesterase [Polyangiaceae bacterium]|nr:metallophosphoesterase [Polyangiaceae bacterium]
MKRTLIVGDIHGCYDELRELFDRAALGEGDLVVSVGDLVDRGPQPAEVLRWFRARPGAVVVAGNHERKHARGVLSYAQQITRLQLGEGYGEATAWMGKLPYYYEGGGVRVVHAAMLPGRPLSEQPEEVLCGSTAGEAALREALPGGFWHEAYDDPTPVVFGHHVVGPEPLVREGRVYGIDTGACHGMRLTALVLPSFELVSVAARTDHWRETKRRWQVPVLRQRPWLTMDFDQIDRKVSELARGADAEATAYLAGVRAWSEQVRAAIPALASAADAAIARLAEAHGDEGFRRAAAAHPAGSTLIRRQMGRLSTERLGCSHADAVLTLASQLGVTLALPPAP